jgi:arsenate reductase
MAEGLVNHFLADHVEAYSAGTHPARVHPRAIAVMAELGIDISGQRSKDLDELSTQVFDHVITLCSDADRRCPIYIGTARKLHIGFPDPVRAVGSEEEIMDQFREVRDAIRNEILPYLKHLSRST